MPASCLTMHAPCIFIIFIFVLLFSFLSPIQAHFRDPTVAAFPISLRENSSATVRLPAPDTASCTFSYSTQPRAIEEISISPLTPSGEKSQFSLDAWLSLMSGKGLCGTTPHQYWDYTVCLLDTVKQHRSDGDSYLLGRNPKVQTFPTILFTDGDKCTTSTYTGPRQTVVSVACDPDGSPSTIRVGSIGEPSTCHYQLTVSTVLACADARYPVMTHTDPASNAGDNSDGTEDWFMEITSLNEAAQQTNSASSSLTSSSTVHPVSVRCTVYSLEAKALHSGLNFEHFALTINTGQIGRAHV